MSTAKNIFLMVAVFVSVILLWNFLNSVQNGSPDEKTYSEFTALMDQGVIKETIITQSGQVTGKYLPEDAESVRDFKAVIPRDGIDTIATHLSDNGIAVEIKNDEQNSWVYVLLSSGLPILLFIGFWVFIMRQMQAGGNRALSFGKSRAKLSTDKHKKVTFEDVAGVDEAKEELEEIVEFLSEPRKFQKLGGRIPKGVLVMGPPGTGKTLLARAIAGEADVPFFTISGSDFVEMFVGVGASRVRDLFEQGKKNAPCIVFIDEIDAVGRHRGAGLGGGHDEREQTLNQLLVEMDGFESNEGVILIAATNRPDVLDPALLRPGRFDRQVVISLPDIRGRQGILKVHTRNVPLGDEVDIAILARGTPGFSGAQLENLVNEAALNAARFDRAVVTMNDLEEAKDKCLMGKERRSMVMNEKEKKNTAYHEAGHALAAHFLPESDPLHKVTIIPRGRALGVTMQLPKEDHYNYTREYMLATITILLAGRAAEEIFLGDTTTGASNDMERTTDLARKMVCEWGMSKLGPVTFGKNEEQIFLGREISRHQYYSESTAINIDEELKRIISDCDQRTRKILKENRKALIRLAQALLEYETLESNEVEAIIKGEAIRQAEKQGEPSKSVPDSNQKEIKEDEKKVGPMVNPSERPATA